MIWSPELPTTLQYHRPMLRQCIWQIPTCYPIDKYCMYSIGPRRFPESTGPVNSCYRICLRNGHSGTFDYSIALGGHMLHIYTFWLRGPWHSTGRTQKTPRQALKSGFARVFSSFFYAGAYPDRLYVG